MYVLIDEYSYIKIDDQATTLDYIYRIFFNTPFYIKLATNRYKSKLDTEKDGEHFGLVEGEEFIAIDLDFTLEKFESAEKFLLDILKSNSDNVNIKNIESWFGNEAFPRLVWAPGGVPRDFIGLMVKILDNLEESNKIDKRIINKASQSYFNEKLINFNKNNSGIYELWDKIESFCIKVHSRTAFLIESDKKSMLEDDNFKALIDARIIHLVDRNITKKSQPGKRFDAYILNIGSYVKGLNLRKDKVHEINILKKFSKTRDSELRSIAPIIDDNSLKNVENLILNKNKILKDKEKKAVEKEKVKKPIMKKIKTLDKFF